jgi:hypothetical protein
MVGWCVLGKQFLRAEIGWVRGWSGVGSILLATLAAGCTIDPPNYLEQNKPALDPDEPATSNVPSNVTTRPTRRDAGASPVHVDAGHEQTEIPALVGGCTEGATRPCGPTTVSGICKLGKFSCVSGEWSECEGAIFPAPRDCSSALDNDCDGFPDNTVDDTCQCLADTKEPCETHAGFDGHGPCHAGERSCLLAADKLSSEWGECTGAVGPVPKDSCTVKTDDSDCDGTPNGGCVCIENDVINCGPPAELGICKFGKSTCVHNAYSACVGATIATARDCSSALDNDCDGTPDNTVDAVCTCTIGEKQACGEHAELDGNGICKAGEQTCIAGVGGRTSSFGPCTGSVGPAARNCSSSVDNDCDGTPDNTVDSTCACTVGAVVECTTALLGNCHAGLQTCMVIGAGTGFSACAGAVAKAADSCTIAGDDASCDGVANGGCDCVAGQGCTDAAAAHCNTSGTCSACTSNADCASISGLNVCSAGVCVECTATSSAACSATEVCTSNQCVAAPPPPPPPPAAETP